MQKILYKKKGLGVRPEIFQICAAKSEDHAIIACRLTYLLGKK